jgi:hypothetical protein
MHSIALHAPLLSNQSPEALILGLGTFLPNEYSDRAAKQMQHAVPSQEPCQAHTLMA